MTDSAGAPRFLGAVVFLLSAVGISYQIALMRVLSVAQWHHFAYMIISIAMLGFAASGTAVATLGRRLAGREAGAFRAGAALLPVALVGCYALSQRIGFETFELASQPRQFWNLFALYLVLAVPFALVSWCVALGFLLRPARVGRIYFLTMVGSGCGAAAVVGLLFAADPGTLPYLLAIPAALALLLGAADAGRGPAAALTIPGLLAVGLLAGAAGLVPVRVSSYKGLSYALQLPDAEIAAAARSPLSVVTAVRSAFIRETPGQLSAYPMDSLGPLPEQMGLFFDGGSVSPVHRFDGDLGRFAFLDYVTSALAYRLVDRPRVLVLGAGGGTEVLSALAHSARRVTAVEVDPNVLRLVRGPLGEMAGGLYDRTDVEPVLAEGRGYLEAQREARFDLIQISLLDAFNAAAAGVQALNESYLYTREAVSLYVRRLAPGGVLAITRWLQTPPRDAIKMLATVIEAAERAGIERPGDHLLMIRSWNTATLVLSRAPLTAAQVDAARRFAASRWFDVAHAPGLRPEEVNRYTVLEEPIYYRAAASLLSEDRERFYRDYLFYVRPATDDRPHFFRFFRWRSLPALRTAIAAGSSGLVEWGYLALVATLAQAAVAGAVLVLLPLWLFGRPAGGRGAGGRGAVVLYFGALGLAFMLLEIAFIQKLMLLLDYPIYAVAVALTGFLVFSGFGSYVADLRRSSSGHLVRWASLAIAGLSVVYLAGLPPLFEGASGWPDGGRIGLSLALLAPLAFAMGIPFPAGLQAVSTRRRWLVPWAWGWNGAASVVGAALATLVAVHLGFRVVVVLAVLMYGVAAFSFRSLGAEHEDGGGAPASAATSHPE